MVLPTSSANDLARAPLTRRSLLPPFGCLLLPPFVVATLHQLQLHSPLFHLATSPPHHLTTSVKLTWEVPMQRSSGLTNPKIVQLHVCCDPTLRESGANKNKPQFGWAPMRFNLHVGTHLVARADGKPPTGETVDAMADFCRWHLLTYFQKCEESGDSEDLDEMSPRHSELRQKVMDQITPDKWKTYLVQWKAEQADRSAAESRGGRVYTIEKARAGLERMGLTEEDSDRVQCILFNGHDQHLEMYGLKYGGD